MRRWAWLVLFVTGCQRWFGLDHVPDVQPDAEVAIDVEPDALPPVMGCTPTSDSHRFYDLRDDELTFEMSDTGIGTSNTVEVKLESPTYNTFAEFVRDGSNLVVRRATAGGNPAIEQILSTQYSATDHRFLRFTAHADMLSFWTAPSAAGPFTMLTTQSGFKWTNHVKPKIFASRNGLQFAFTIHNVHGGASTVGACPIRELGDDFEDGVLGDAWARGVVYGGTQSETNGAYQIDYPGSASVTLNATIAPLGLYDMRDGSVTVEIDKMFDKASTIKFLMQVKPLGVASAAFEVANGTLRSLRGGSPSNTMTFNATAHRFLRIANEGLVTKWQTSTDGTTFANFAQDTNVDGLDLVDIHLYGNGLQPTPEQLRIGSIVGK